MSESEEESESEGERGEQRETDIRSERESVGERVREIEFVRVCV